MAKKKKTYMERMTEKYGTANGASSASLSTASGNAGTNKTSTGSSSGSQSYLERMTAKYGSTQQAQPVVNPVTQRKVVQSVRGNISNNTSGTKDNAANKLTKGTKIDAADIEKFKGQSMQNLDTDRYVQNQVDSYKKPTVTDAIKNHNKTSYNTKPLGSYISTALKSSGNPTGKDPDSLYRTNDMAEETLNAYREAARKDSKNPLNQAVKGGKGSETYNYMSDAEKNRYNEIYGVYGARQAEEYKALMEDVINERIGQANYKNKYADSNVLNKTAYQLGRGIGSGVEGVGRAGAALIGLTNSHANSAADYTASAMRSDEKNSSIENAVYDIANSTGYMLPGMIASTVAAPVAGAAAAGAIGNSLFALAQYGNTYRDDINAGRSAGKSQLHALQQGIDELATNWLLGGIGTFGGGTLTKVFKDTAVGKAFKNGVSKLTSNPTARRLLTSFAEYLTDAGSEAAQEYTQYYTNAITENLLFDADNDLSLTNSEAWYSALLGGLNAMVLNAPNYAQRTASDVHTIREGLKPELNTSEGLTALAENIANNDAASQNDALHEMSNETFDKVMEMNSRLENGQKVSAIEKGEAAIAARNIEAVSKMENTMRQAVEARETVETREKATEEQKQATEELSLAAVRETDNSKIADNKAGFEEYTAENAAGLYSEDSRNNMVSLYDGTVDADRYRQAYQRAYTAGFNNIEEKTAYNSMNMLYLNNEQKLQAYKDGMRDSNLYAQRKIEFEKGEAREGGLIEGTDKVNESTGKFLDWAGKKTGVKIQIVEGLKGAAEINLDKGVMKINPYSENFVGSASHELTHLIKLYDRKSFDKLQKLTVESMMKSNNMSYEELYAKYEKSYREQASEDYTVEDILEEITADGATAYLNDADFAERVVKEDRGLGKKIADFFREIADTLKAIINERGIRAVGRVMRENEARYRTAANIWYQALENAGTKYKEGYTAVTDAGSKGTQYQIDPDFETKFDKWLEAGKPSGMRFRLGTTSKALQSIGVNPKNIYMYSSKINTILKTHSEMTESVIKQIPQILEDPVVIMGSKTRETALTIFGDIKAENGENVLVALELKPIDKRSERSQDYLVVLSAYSKENLQNYLNSGIIYYIDENKKRTNNWAAVNRVQFPLGLTQLGSIKKIPQGIQNSNDESKENTKLQLFDEPIEYTKDLIAVRNVNSKNLASMLELEGMPSPSIAITKDSLGHTQFGDVTFIFGRDTIDPEADSRNMVFTADAWTPTFDQLGVDTEIKEDKLVNMRNKLYAYQQENDTFGGSPTDSDNLRYGLERNNGDLTKIADNSYDWKLIYLQDIGKPYGKFPQSSRGSNLSRTFSNEDIIRFAEDSDLLSIAEGMDREAGEEQGKLRKQYCQEHSEEVRKAIKRLSGQELFKDSDMFIVKAGKTRDVLDAINAYNDRGITENTFIDKDRAREEIDKSIDTADYHKWIAENFKGVIGKKGVRNEKDMVDPSGNRRSFRELHDAYTAENIVKALWRNAEQGVSSFGSASHSARTVRGATAEKMDSIADIHSKSDLLQSDVSSNVGEMIDAADEKLSNIYNAVSERAGSWSIGWDEAYNESTIKAATKAKTANEVRKYFADNGIKINETEAKQLFDIFEELRNLPTDYFEAKAKRVVAWDEVKIALVPDDIDAALIEQMREAGISDIRTYPAGDNEARAEMESKADNLKFQLDIDDDPEWSYYTNMVQEANQETRDAADTLGELLSAVDYMPSNKAIERTAKKLKKYTETDTSIEEIQSSIKTVFSYIANNEHIDGREISTVLADYAGELISNSHKVEVDPVEQKLFREFRNAIKGHAFHMPKGFKGEIETLGGIRNIRSQSGLAINITKDKGVPIDTLYGELSDMYPDYFDRDVTNPADQLERIIDKYNELRPEPRVSYANEEDYDAFRYYAGQEVFKAYIAEGAAEAGHKAEYRALQNTYKKKLKENAKSEKEMAALQSKAAEMQAKYLSELEASRKKIDKQTHNERVQAARKSMKTRYWKDQIMKDAKELSNWLLKPTDKKHVPEALREPLANFLTQLDFTSLNLAENGEPTQRSIYWMQLKDTWAKIAQNGGMAEGENGTQYMVVDTDILEKMSQLTDKIKGIKKLEELEYIDALKLNDVMKAMKHSIETANQMISLNRSVQSVATGTLEDLKEVHDNVDLGRLRGVKELLNNQMLDADTRFHTFGKNAESVYKAVRLGFNKKVKHVKESADWFAELVKQVQPTKKDWKGKASAESTVKSWSEDTLTIKLSSGKDLKLTVAQAMNLYNLLKRTQAREHILRGGITLTSFKDESTRKKKVLKAYTNSVNEHVTQEDCLNIINALTPEQKRFADGLANSLQKAAQWGNETSMELMGYKKFNDRFYWPIKSSRDYIATSMDAAAAGGVVGVAVKNAGPTKNVVKKANNPILVGDIMDVWSDHINFMSNYNAFTIPLTDMVKWYNYVDYGDIRDEGSDKYRNSVKQEIRRAYGSTADGYIMRFIEQINGTGNKSDKSVIKNLISMFKGSAVGFNLSVAIQQPTAIARAGAVIDAKYLVGGLTARDTADWETIKKYSAIAQWKDWGFFDTNISKSMKSILTGGNTFIEDMGEKQMWLAGKGDEVTWKRMWAAAELKVRAEHQELTRGSEAYYKKTAEIFDEIIDKTQVVDSVFTKSDLMRSDNELNKMATSFFSEPTKSYNMMYRAWFDWSTAKDAKAKTAMAKQLRRATVCWLLSNVFAAMAKSIITAMRDDDEDRDKAFWDRWFGHTLEEMVGNINPFSYIPWVKDVISVFEGYSVNRSDMQGVEDMYYAASRWAKYFNGESKYTLGNNILYSTKALSSFTGVAFYGAQRDINALIDTAIEAVGADGLNYEKQKLTGLSLGSSNNVSYYLGKAMQAYKEDHKALGDKIVSDMIKAGISEDKINDKKKTLLKENEDMQSLIDDTLSDNEQAADKTRAALIKQGYSDDMIDSVLKSGINTSMEDGGLTYAGLNETLDSITDYTKVGFKEFDETYKEWAEAAKIKNGWDDKKCREQFRSQCTKYFKPKYQEGNSAERSRILNILSRAKSTDGTRIYAKDEDIKKWGK